MESIAPAELAVELLNHCLRGSQWPQDVLQALTDDALDEDERLAAPATRALFSILVERLADLFEPALCDVYAALFSTVIERALPELRASGLQARYRQVRTVRPVTFDPENVFVLSRVTLGADIAVTSILLDAARQRFPKARIWFAGPKRRGNSSRVRLTSTTCPSPTAAAACCPTAWPSSTTSGRRSTSPTA